MVKMVCLTECAGSTEGKSCHCPYGVWQPVQHQVSWAIYGRKLDFGPGYRVYFGYDDSRGELVILLGGGTKKRQSRDIAQAQSFWKDYKRRKKQGQEKVTWH